MATYIGFHWNESENKYDKNLEKCYEINRRPSTHDFVELDDATLRTRQEYLENYDHIAIDTGDIYHIDVDNLNMTDELRSQVEEWKSDSTIFLDERIPTVSKYKSAGANKRKVFKDVIE